jgi:hypothetical protein
MGRGDPPLTITFEKENIMARVLKSGLTSDMRPGNEERYKSPELPEPPKKQKKNLYVSPYKKQGFKVPILGTDGKPMTLTRPGTNMPVFINGRPIQAMRDCEFLTQSDNVKRGCLSYYETDDLQEIEVLEKLAADSSNRIMTEETYLKMKDPVNYDLKVKLAEKDEKIVKMGEESKLQSEIIAELEAKIADLSKGK